MKKNTLLILIVLFSKSVYSKADSLLFLNHHLSISTEHSDYLARSKFTSNYNGKLVNALYIPNLAFGINYHLKNRLYSNLKLGISKKSKLTQLNSFELGIGYELLKSKNYFLSLNLSGNYHSYYFKYYRENPFGYNTFYLNNNLTFTSLGIIYIRNLIHQKLNIYSNVSIGITKALPITLGIGLSTIKKSKKKLSKSQSSKLNFENPKELGVALQIGFKNFVWQNNNADVKGVVSNRVIGIVREFKGFTNTYGRTNPIYNKNIGLEISAKVFKHIPFYTSVGIGIQNFNFSYYGDWGPERTENQRIQNYKLNFLLPLFLKRKSNFKFYTSYTLNYKRLNDEIRNAIYTHIDYIGGFYSQLVNANILAHQLNLGCRTFYSDFLFDAGFNLNLFSDAWTNERYQTYYSKDIFVNGIPTSQIINNITTKKGYYNSNFNYYYEKFGGYYIKIGLFLK